MKRRTKFACLTLVMAVAMAWTATSAQALEWIVEGAPLKLNEKRAVTCEQSGAQDMATEQFGAVIQIEFRKAECKEFVIWNTEGKAEREALSSGKVKFSEGASNILGCTPELTTETLAGKAKLFAGLGTKTGVTYSGAPNIGVLHMAGAGCAIAGEYLIQGTLVAEVPEVNVLVPNPVAFRFDPAVEAVTGDLITVNEEPATFEGLLDFTL